jgi:ABC-2 type transport system ATP-binding protein
VHFVTSLLVVRDLCKEYDGRQVLGPVSFELAAGEVLALVGRNGSGKSTTLGALAGVIDPTSGSVSVEGLTLKPETDQPEYRRRVAYVPDEPLLFPDLTLREHGQFVAGAWGVADGGFELLLERLGIDDVIDDIPATFSRGMRQKAGLALSFLRPASVVLVDEPFSGLDDAGRAAFLELLRDVCSRGAAAVVATHALSRVSSFASRLIRLEEGAVVVDGPTAELISPGADEV